MERFFYTTEEGGTWRVKLTGLPLRALRAMVDAAPSIKSTITLPSPLDLRLHSLLTSDSQRWDALNRRWNVLPGDWDFLPGRYHRVLDEFVNGWDASRGPSWA